MTSLRLRLLLLGGLVVTVAVIAAGLVIAQLFTLHIERRVGQELDTYLEQLAGGVRIAADGAITLAREPVDPRFGQILGGLYWQVSDTTSGYGLRSRSLWDSMLPPTPTDGEPGTTYVHNATVNGEDLLVHERTIIVQSQNVDHLVRLSAAIDRSSIAELRADFARDLIVALAVLGLVLFAGFGFQVFAGLRPLSSLRRSLRQVRHGEASRIDWFGPSEVAPLVEEVNSLLARQEQDLVRARDRAADLAHGLKTPLTAMAGDVARLRSAGEHVIADDLDAAARQMQQHVDRELARARIRHGGYGPRTNVSTVAASIIRNLSRTPDGERVEFTVDAGADVTTHVDAADLTELVGNLLENASRHAAGRVHLRAMLNESELTLAVSDDGPGLADADLAAAVDRGRRLDLSRDGAGLGLAIVTDIASAYGGTVDLERADLGGLTVQVTIPVATGGVP